MQLDSKKKMYVLWGVIAMVLLTLMVRCHNKNVRIEKERAEQMLFEKSARDKLKEVDQAGKNPEQPHSYSTAALKEQLKSDADRVRGIQEESKKLYDFLKEKSGSEQTESVCKEWQMRANRVRDLRADSDRVCQEAGAAYERQVQEWKSNGQTDARLAKKLEEMEKLEQEVGNLYKKARKKKNEVTPSEAAFYGYEMDCRKLKRNQKSLHEQKEQLKNQQEISQRERAAILDENGELNLEAPAVHELTDLLEKIRQTEKYDANSLSAPTVLPEPPPPPFEPDLRMATTGDLADELLVPLIETWLAERGATPIQGSSFVWNMPNEVTKEIELKVPTSLQGKDTGRLRIRIMTEPNGAAIFDYIRCGKEKADLVLTGRKMNTLQEKEWLPIGQTLAQLDPQGHGRAYRTRVCSDALLFFRGGDIRDNNCLDAKSLSTVPKLYSTDDDGRSEAAGIFGLVPTKNDAQVATTQGKSIQTLCTQFKRCIVLGSWHKDSQNRHNAMSTAGGPTLSYSAGLSVGAVDVASSYKRFLKDYSNKGCLPTESTINSGQYAFAYNVSLYRATTTSSDSVAADFMNWAGDATSEKLASLVKSRGFVPIRMEKPNADSQLTDADLPIDELLRILGERYGYTRRVNTWVRGTRIAVPLYYAVGSSKTGESSVAVDPDSVYYTEKQAIDIIRTLTEGRLACLVLVGHADPQYGGRLDVGDGSWKFNDNLSRKRAELIYSTLFGKTCPDSTTLTHATLGCSWARPACDIDLKKSIDAQENALSRCRRVEVFVVFPLTREEDD